MNPFHSLASLLVTLLPEGAGDAAVGIAVMLGIFLGLTGVFALAAGIAVIADKVKG